MDTITISDLALLTHIITRREDELTSLEPNPELEISEI